MPLTEAALVRPPIHSLAEALEHAATSQAGLRLFDGKGALAAEASYLELFVQARARATQLRCVARTGSIPPVIGLIAHTHLSFIVNFMACQWAGLLPCPIPSPTVALGIGPYVQRVRRMLSAVQAKALLLDDTHASLQSHFERFAEPEIKGLSLMTTGSLPAADETVNLLPLQADEGAYIQFSSGTTSAPKGIEISQRAICHNLNGILHAGLCIQPGDRAFSWLPLYHDMGLVGFLLAPIMGAVPLDLLPPQVFARRPQLWPRLMAELQSTICFAPSFAWGLAAEKTPLDEAQHIRLNLRVAGVGGDVVRMQDLNRFAERFGAGGFTVGQFRPSYGLAEATLAVSMGPVSTDKQGHLASGKPLTGWEVRVVDETGAVLPPLQAGRIQIRGLALMTGYWQNGHLSPVQPDEWFLTDDLGYLSTAGELVVTGRLQSLLVLRGRNVHAEAIEDAVRSALHLSHGTVLAYQEIPQQSSSTGLVVLVECPLQDVEQREQWTVTARKAAFEASRDAAEIRLVPPRTVKLTSSGKMARQITLDHVRNVHE
ncbi:AMP-binding protein [Ottowia thiooxydans]|uniref:AMP-binding protein n=1 Tax=Ottowia thiooxydans TaxID=219182 RepID=UPI00048D14D0|nr:AMP-binding protein [Ottowia thiooxydans]